MFKQLIIASVAMISAFPALAVEIFAIDIPGLHNKDMSGAYDVIIKKVDGAQLKELPAIRAENTFNQSSNGCLSPANKNANFYPDWDIDSIIVSKPMSVAKVYIFTPHGSDSINDLAQLVGKKVGARAGFPYGKKVDESGIKLVLTKSMEQNIKKLQSGRLDAIIDYTPDMYTAFDEMGIPPLSFDKDHPVEIHNDSVICKKTPETEDFINKLNSALAL